MADPVGPIFTGGFEEFVTTDNNGMEYTILYLPDRNNEQLQREGKPAVYYWVPGTVRLAQFGDNGDYKFRHIHFVGLLDEDSHVGVEGNSEVSGGVLSFTVTSRYPTEVLRQAEQQLLDKFSGDNDRYWGWRTPVAPTFRIAPIRENITAITNLAPGSDGTAPIENVPTTSRAILNARRDIIPGSSNPSAEVKFADLDQPVIHAREDDGTNEIENLGAWAWELQGQGPGSVTGGENAYSGLIGALPSEIVWAGFHGGASPIVATQQMLLPVWSQEIYLKITGNWDRIFQHFSAHANASYLWFRGDVKAEFNQLRISGGIEVEIAIDGTIPGAEEMNDAIDERIDLIVERFMEQASQRIFEPAPPEVEPAKARSGGLFSRIFGGGGLALKYRRDETKLNLHYEETRYFRYNQPNVVSSSFEGFFNAMKNDPDAERKYFQRIVLGDLSRKVLRIVKPVVNWPRPDQNWIGEPVAYLSAEIGYPVSTGSIQWKPAQFQSSDTSDESNKRIEFVRRETDEIANPPAEWNPDQTYIRRKVSLVESAGITDNPYAIVMVEKNIIDIDPPEGQLMNESIVEVRADSVGKLEVGPIDIDATLTDNTQIVTVEFKADGQTHDGHERPVVKFQWKYDDYDHPRFWEIFTGQPDYVPNYHYRVLVNVKGTLFSSGMAWAGPWLEGRGNGPLMVHVPLADEPGVEAISRSAREIATEFETIPEEISNTPPPVRNTNNGGNVNQPPGGSLGNGNNNDGNQPPAGPPGTQRDEQSDSNQQLGGYTIGTQNPPPNS